MYKHKKLFCFFNKYMINTLKINCDTIGYSYIYKYYTFLYQSLVVHVYCTKFTFKRMVNNIPEYININAYYL